MDTTDGPAGFGARLDAAGWNRTHTRILLGLGVGWALVAFEVQILGSVITPLGTEFGLLGPDGSIDAGALSLIWVVWFVGLLIGAAVFGWLSDRVGRRRLFVATLVVYALATVATALAPAFGVFLLFRFVTALGVGGEYSAVTAAITEFVPARRRGGAIAVTMNFWSLGGAVAGLVGLVALSGLATDVLTVAGTTIGGWRLALLTGVLGALYALFARRHVPESPRWLASRGRTDEADAVVTSVSNMPSGGISAESPREAAALSRPSFGAQARRVWRAGRSRVLYGMVLDFSGSGAYYGLFTFVSAYVLTTERIGIASGTAPVFNLVANLGALIGGIAVAAALDRVGRAPTVVASYTAAAATSVLLALAALTGSPVLVMIVFALAAFAATCAWISAYATFAELFPTSLRATGIGMCVGAGRVGGIVGVVGLSYTTGVLGLVPAFVLLAVFFGLGAVAALWWRTHGVEGQHRPLDQLSTYSTP